MSNDHWVSLAEKKPALDQQVLLANVNRMKAFEPHGCAKDVGVMCDLGAGPFWSTQGETRAQCIDAYTHWFPISEPDAGICPDCHGKGGKAPNGVEYCNCD